MEVVFCFVLLLGPHLAVLSELLTPGELREQYAMLASKPESAMCTENGLLAVLSLWPLEVGTFCKGW